MVRPLDVRNVHCLLWRSTMLQVPKVLSVSAPGELHDDFFWHSHLRYHQGGITDHRAADLAPAHFLSLRRAAPRQGRVVLLAIHNERICFDRASGVCSASDRIDQLDSNWIRPHPRKNCWSLRKDLTVSEDPGYCKSRVV